MGKAAVSDQRKTSFKTRLAKDFRQYRGAYLMLLPVLLYYLIFCYKPMFGIVIAFKNFSPRKGIFGSPWAGSYGFEHFIKFFQSYYFTRVLTNTLTISLSSLILCFPIPIIFALLLNEVQSKWFRKTIQTVSYMPYFISLVVVCSMIRLFVGPHGFVLQLLAPFGFDPDISLLNNPNAFVPIYLISDIWQNTGWNCIIYLAALAGIDQELYEVAKTDGAGRFKQTLHVTLPGIAGTVILLLILRMGSVLNVGYEKIILLYNDYNLEKSDVISSFVYRKGLVNGDYSYSVAVGLFNSIINFAMVVIANKISNKVSGYGIW